MTPVEEVHRLATVVVEPKNRTLKLSLLICPHFLTLPYFLKFFFIIKVLSVNVECASSLIIPTTRGFPHHLQSLLPVAFVLALNYNRRFAVFCFSKNVLITIG